MGTWQTPLRRTSQIGRAVIEPVVPYQHLFEPWQVGLTTIYEPLNLIRQYCGLPFIDRGRECEPETWAFPFFDEVPFPEGDVTRPIDVLASSTVSASARFEHLEFFQDYGFDRLRRWVAELPADISLDEASDDVLEVIGTLNELTDEVPLSLVSKVAYRLRPELIPIYEATTASLYRKRTDGRGESSWPNLVRELAIDLGSEKNPCINFVKVQIDHELKQHGSAVRLSKVRLLDVALFMASQLGFHEPERYQHMQQHMAKRRDLVEQRRAAEETWKNSSRSFKREYKDAWKF